MGLMFSSTALTASCSAEFRVPAREAEKLLTDVEAVPGFVPHLLSLEIIGDGPFQVGTQWREVRMYNGRKVVACKKVTKIHRDANHGLTIHVSMERRIKKQASQTGSMIVQPIDDNSCLVIWTMAYISPGICSKISSTLFRYCILSKVRQYLDKEMSCYAQEAERRAKIAKDETIG